MGLFKKKKSTIENPIVTKDVNEGNVTETLKSNVVQEKKENLSVFKYEVRDQHGQVIKSLFEAKDKSEVENYLVNEGYTVISIIPRKPYEISIGKNKVKRAELSFLLTQLATYIKAGIPLIDAVRILAKQTVKPDKRKVYERIVYDLVGGESFSTALSNQESVFPRLLINMVRTAEMTGDLPSILEEMADYYDSTEKTRKQMITALTYPSIVFTLSVIVIAFILIWVVPSFVEMYADQGSSLPGITQFTINVSDFLGKSYMYIIAVIVIVILLFSNAYKNIKGFRKNVQIFMMKFPVLGKIIIYNEVTMFTKTFASLLNHSVYITDSMEILSKITNNEVYKEVIYNTINNLGKGGAVSESFRGQWAVPVVAYEMILTGERTGQLGLMMEKVADFYSESHKNAVTMLKSLIEPVTIAFLAIAVGFILLSILIPMFNMYNTIQQ